MRQFSGSALFLSRGLWESNAGSEARWQASVYPVSNHCCCFLKWAVSTDIWCNKWKQKLFQVQNTFNKLSEKTPSLITQPLGNSGDSKRNARRAPWLPSEGTAGLWRPQASRLRESQHRASNTSNGEDGKQLRLSDKSRPELVFANKERLGTATEKIMAQAGKKMGLIPKYFKRCLHVS